jgi:hypothetical protein
VAIKREWGAMTDRRSRLRSLAVRIEREQLKVQYPDLPDWAWRYRRSAARFLALSEMVIDQIGSDPRATPRKAWALQKAAEVQLRKLKDYSAVPSRSRGPNLAEIRQRYVNGHPADEVAPARIERAGSR